MVDLTVANKLSTAIKSENQQTVEIRLRQALNASAVATIGLDGSLDDTINQTIDSSSTLVAGYVIQNRNQIVFGPLDGFITSTVTADGRVTHVATPATVVDWTLKFPIASNFWQFAVMAKARGFLMDTTVYTTNPTTQYNSAGTVYESTVILGTLFDAAFTAMPSGVSVSDGDTYDTVLSGSTTLPKDSPDNGVRAIRSGQVTI